MFPFVHVSVLGQVNSAYRLSKSTKEQQHLHPQELAKKMSQ